MTVKLDKERVLRSSVFERNHTQEFKKEFKELVFLKDARLYQDLLMNTVVWFHEQVWFLKPLHQDLLKKRDNFVHLNQINLLSEASVGSLGASVFM